jgi:hypothetical protein
MTPDRVNTIKHGMPSGINHRFNPSPVIWKFSASCFRAEPIDIKKIL